MKPYKKGTRSEPPEDGEDGFSDCYYIDLRWRGYPRLQLSTRTRDLKRAEGIVSTLERIRALGRRDIIGLLAERKLAIEDVHDIGQKDLSALDVHIREATDRTLGPLVDEWLIWLAEPSTLSPRRRLPYSPETVDRYRQSWEKLFSSLPKGREARPSHLTKGFFAQYRKDRVAAGRAGATVNRDIDAVSSLLRWAREIKELNVPHIMIQKESEPEGRDRWLTSDEIALVEAAVPEEWWTLFAVLIHTGMRLGEAQSLVWGDFNFRDGVVDVRGKVQLDGTRRTKSKAGRRSVFITNELQQLLQAHAQTVASRPVDKLFPDRRAIKRSAYNAWKGTVRRAGIAHVTLHDLRHTFATHLILAGIPIPRVQRLLGHSTPAMTIRYARHLPDEHFNGDAQRLSQSLGKARSSVAAITLVREA
jgi:integrase